MATEYTEFLRLGKIPPQDLFNIGVLNSNADAIDAAMQKAVQGKAARNLLVNSWFADLVNQQGATTYSGSNYMIDGWKGAPCELTVNNGSITVGKGSQSYGILAQFTPQLTVGKTYTLAAQNSAGEIATLTFVPQVGMANLAASFSTSGHTVIARHSTASAVFYVGVATTADEPLNIVWIALYEGNYTKAELPEYVPKGWTAEYLDCVREYYRIPSGGVPGTGVVSSTTTVALIAIHLPAPMRIAPTAKLLTAGEVRAGGTSRAVQSIAVHNQRGNVVLLDVTVASALPAGHAAALVTTGFELDARI